MIGYIKGDIELITNDLIVIENNGIGYRINVNDRTISKISNKIKGVKIFTFMNVKEDEISLFGFTNLDELNIFKKLITVSGVGPKGALSLLNCMSADELITSIICSDIKKLSSGQGIGKKIAARISMELKEKVEISLPFKETQNSLNITDENSEVKEAVEALTALGFSKSEIMLKVSSTDLDNLTSSQIISLLLKKLSK